MKIVKMEIVKRRETVNKFTCDYKHSCKCRTGRSTHFQEQLESTTTGLAWGHKCCVRKRRGRLARAKLLVKSKSVGGEGYFVPDFYHVLLNGHVSRTAATSLTFFSPEFISSWGKIDSYHWIWCEMASFADVDIRGCLRPPTPPPTDYRTY